MIYGNDPSIEFGDTTGHIGAALRIITGLLLSGALIGAMAQRPDPNDWPVYSGTDNGQRYSPLKQITAANANRLQAKWVYTWMVQAGWSKRPS